MKKEKLSNKFDGRTSDRKIEKRCMKEYEIIFENN